MHMVEIQLHDDVCIYIGIHSFTGIYIYTNYFIHKINTHQILFHFPLINK